MQEKMSGGSMTGKSGNRAESSRIFRSRTERRVIVGVAAAIVSVLTVAQIAAAPAGTAPRHPLTAGSVWDSVFTLVQAGRGESTFRASCSNCHGDSLMGINDAPALRGPDFMKNWDGNTLSKLFNRINNDMPSDNPGSLTKQQVADVEAYLLKWNAFPPGSKELPAASESLTTIKILKAP
jgi:mono/diheme cytochrome c family protein